MDTGSWRPRIGDRARVRIGVGTAMNCDEVPHCPEEQGHPCRVFDECPQPDAPHHPFLVAFDRPVPQVAIGRARVSLWTRHYAAHELEPLDA